MTRETLGSLWQRYFEARRRLAEADASRGRELRRRADGYRDRLVTNYSPLVKYVAGRVYARVGKHLDLGDLISWGLVGLLEAVESFEPERNVKFESYAISKIRWAMLNEIRQQDWVPRSVRRRAQDVERATNALIHRLRRTPSDEEVAEELGISFEEYRRFQSQYSRSQVASLEARIEGEEGVEFQSLIADTGAPDPQSWADRRELREQLIAAIETLDDRERLVAMFYFYEGLTLKEIGRAMNLTEGRVSQIRQKALRKLREHLAHHPVALNL
ncbi:FliA/WhiG family RNA polymerase sigma factor [Rubrobacter taiwanensis]|jgi:RNA polymerase sigma factor for flagellar operon FliA|uniref:FliA/WhiG family RNA polymerase sigma factor n=1 Tax=Rubrobacter taiwanensis TaxID=185139 RepID=A0A4V2NWA4_9ACTN|nr:FliA/WhiG family RNA polymerase sigma factor [Rubrobacter taiwanensis]TCJ16642.1 FliA/WhiG family RNA polymerase sigma factor [Rubrobacter taiwanensis]